MNDNLAPQPPEDGDKRKTLDFYIEDRGGKKRNYIFPHRSSCPHSKLTALSIGGNWYRCGDCNWAFDIVTAYAQPLHNLVIGGMLNALHFAKEFGGNALQEVLRRPIGQYDGTAQKSVLPEGMSFSDAVAALEGIDVNTEDGGKEQLVQTLERFWVSEKERERRQTAIEGMDETRRPLQGQRERGALQNGGDEDKGNSETDTS